MLARIAILGRPNVGKSTLFNRFCGWRKALVHDEPGVTRDRLQAEGRLGSLRFSMIDTAGLEFDPASTRSVIKDGAGTLSERLLRQSMIGLEEADFGILLIDGRDGVTALDKAIADLVRRQSKPVIVVVNKCEAAAVKAVASEAWSLGLGEPVAISAEHGEGLLDLADRIEPYLTEKDATEPPDEDSETAERAIKFAVVGRPNAGKSTLINKLLDEDRLLTGPEPGLTRDAVSLSFEQNGRLFELVDTAGLRRRARVDGRVEQLSGSQTIRAIRMSHIVALMLDATHMIEKQDLTIANLALDEGRGLVIVANKWDLLKDPRGAERAIADRLQTSLTQVRGIPVIPISAKTGRGIPKIMPVVLDLHERWSGKFSTSQLNRWLGEALEINPPPLVQNRRLKIRYMTQTAKRPPTFAFFANKPPSAIPEHYKRYLVTGLRERFNLQGVVIRMIFKHGANPYDPQS